MSLLIGSARISVTPDISNFGDELKAKIDAETRAAGDATIPVQFNVDDASIAKVRAALGAFGDATIPVQFNVDDASIAKARAAMGLLGGDTAPVQFDVDPASIAKARAELGVLGGETAPIEVGVDLASIAKVNAEIRAGLTAETVPVEVGVDPASIAKADTEIRAGLTAGGTDLVEVGAKADLASVVAANEAIKATLDVLSAGDKVRLSFDADTGVIAAATVATNGLATATDNAGEAAHRAYGWMGLLTREIPLFAGAAGMSVPVWHLLLDTVIEFGAVAVPALGAAALGLGEFALASIAAGDPAGDLVEHVRALYTVSQATGTAMPFLTHSLNDLTTAIRPEVWGLFGDAIDAVNSKFGSMGSLAVKTGGVLDTFGARIVVDMTTGGSALNTFLTEGQKDLAMFGGVLVSLGNAFANLLKAAEVTHIAEDLLAVVGAAAQLLDWITKLPAPLLIAGLAMHGLYLWGGLAVTVVTKIGTALVGMATGIGGLAVKIGGIGSALVNSSGAAGSLGDRLVTASGAGGKLGEALGFIGDNPWVAVIATGVIAITAFAIWMSRAKDATDQWVTASQKAVQNASIYSLVNTEAAQLVATNQKLATATDNLTTAQTGSFLGLVQGSHDAQALTANHALLNQELGSTVTHADQIASTFGTSLPGAYALANFAGLKVSDMTTTQNKTWDTAMQKIQGVITGYANMGQGMGQIGNDVSAVTYAASDQLKAISNLNSAWDTFTKNVAAPVSTFLTFAQSIVTFGNDAKASGAQMSGLGDGAVSMSKKVTTASIQLQQDFQSSYSSAEQLFDAMRTSQAPADQQVKAIKDTVAVLIPLAGTNKEAAAQISALAQEAGGPATTNLQTLQKWAGVTASQGMTGLQKDTNNAATAMSNLSIDAQNLATALQQDLTADMSKAIGAAVGIQGAMNNYATAVHNTGVANANASPSYTVLYNDLIAIGESPAQAISQMNALSGTFKTTGGAADTLGTPHLSNLQQAMTNTSGKTGTLGFAVGTTLPANLQTAGQKLDTLGSPHAANLQQALLDTTGKTAGFSFAVGTTMPQNIATGNAAMTSSTNGPVAGLTRGVSMLGTAITNVPASKALSLTEAATGTWSIQEALTKTSGKGGILPTPSGQAAGGLIAGGSGRPKADDIPALLSHNEYVVQADAVKHYGTGFFDQVNAKRFAAGGSAKGPLDAHQKHVAHLEHLHHQHARHVEHLEHLHHEHEEHLTHLRHEGELPGTAAVHPSAHIAQPAAKAVAHPIVAAHQKHVAHVDHLEHLHHQHEEHLAHVKHLHHQHEEHLAHLRHIKAPGFASGGLASGDYSGTPAGMGTWTTNEYNSTVTGMETELEKAINTAAAAAKASAAAAAASGGGIGTAGVANSSAEAALQSAAAKAGWTGAQWQALYNVEMAEAGFSLTAQNPGSGAYGLAQFINGASEYAQYGGNSSTAAGQAVAMVNYIKQRYNDPEAAWAHEQADHWYRNGGIIPEPVAGIGMHSGDRYHFGENGPETVTPGVGGTGAGVNIQFFGPQYPSPEMQQAMLMKASAMIGVS